MGGPIFNYDLQVWIAGPDHRVKPCRHPETMRRCGPCCNANRWAGLTEDAATAAHERATVR
jgi:hypothetical protein